ncbi:MAG: ASKHA domain-containing protein [Clostridiales bacterium]|nr:ASKHA domain-containing protein [Clostridiales bacterium]
MSIKIFFPGENLSAEASSGQSLLDVIHAHELPIEALCNGRGTCGKCRVLVNGQERLACKTPTEDGMEVRILSSAEEIEVLTRTGGAADGQQDGSPAPLSGRAAIAVDIGTTTVALEMLDPANGRRLGVRGFANPQRAYGADVLSRINISMDDATLLSGLITHAVDGAVTSLLKQAGVPAASVEKVIIAGNTTMTYLLLNLRCRSLGLAPFQPEFTPEPVQDYEKIFHTKTLGCPVLLYPYISAFVGGDITSGLAHIVRHYPHDSFMLVDMGTNGEIAFSRDGRLLTTSTAAGPALEGGNITCGMSGVEGAIYAAAALGADGFAVRTIGGGPAAGICGSGVIDLVASLLRAGFVQETGAFSETIPEGLLTEAPAPSSSEKANPRPFKAVRIAPGAPASADIVFTQKDVREFQLAKGAIRAGIEILMKEMGAVPDVFYLAGGFGQRIDLESAMRVGLIPESLRGRIRFVGNTSLGGCVDACMDAGEGAEGGGDAKQPDPGDFARRAEEINLGVHPDFNNTFMETMMF